MKFDFAHMLLRRKFSVERWLESEGISTVKSLKNWMKDNDAQYTFTQEFIAEAKAVLSKEPEKATGLPDFVKNALVELPSSSSEVPSVEPPVSEEKPSVEEDRPKNKKRV